MKIEITKELENEIDAMIGVAKTFAGIKSLNKACFDILMKQYLPETSYNSKPIQDTLENLKVRLYAEIIKKKNETAIKVDREIESK